MKQIVFVVGTQLVENLTTIREKEAEVEYVGEKKNRINELNVLSKVAMTFSMTTFSIKTLSITLK